MKINESIQIPFKSLANSTIDLFICSSGYEERASHVSKNLNTLIINSKIAFAFNDRKSEFSRAINDKYFTKCGFQFINSDGDLDKEVIEYLNSFLKLVNQKKEINILVDYSCMTRIWYSSILKYFMFNDYPKKIINILFSYSIAKYVDSPEQETYNIHIGPIRGFTSVSVPQKPTALIIGLGYEKNRAIGLNEYFDGETFLFYTDTTKEPEYSYEVETKNKEIIFKTKKQNIYKYPLNNLNDTMDTLSLLCQDLSRSYRIVIAPCGPKPFTLLSLTTALKFENIDVWRISSGTEAIPVDKKAEGEIIVFKISFIDF